MCIVIKNNTIVKILICYVYYACNMDLVDLCKIRVTRLLVAARGSPGGGVQHTVAGRARVAAVHGATQARFRAKLRALRGETNISSKCLLK